MYFYLISVDTIKSVDDSKLNITKSRNETVKRRDSKKNVVYNSLKNDKNHGIITQSALMELRAAGLR